MRFNFFGQSLKRISSALLFLSVSLFCIQGNAKDFELLDASIMDMQQAMDKGQLTSVELVEQYLARIAVYDQKNAQLNAIISINPLALQQARDLDKERRGSGARSPLHGIPILVKDNFNTVDMPTTAGSVAFAGFIPKYDAAMVSKLKSAGAIVLAKTNMDELAMGGAGLSSLGGQTKNPYDLSISPGGSSGGSAVGVAAGFAAISLGTDTCGSLRKPAAFNGLVVLRPSKSRSNISGIIPLLGTDDVGGPMARTVEDLAIAMDALKLSSPIYSRSNASHMNVETGFVESLGNVNLSGLRIGKLSGYFNTNKHSGLSITTQRALAQLEKAGVTIVDIDTTLLDSLIEKANPSPPTEYKTDMEHFFSVNTNAGFSSIKDFIERGLYHQFLDTNRIPLVVFTGAAPTKEQVKQRMRWKQLLNDTIEQTMTENKLDALIYPITKALPPKLGSTSQGSNCALSVMSGAPAINIPIGLTQPGIPIGLELLSPAGSDERLVAIAYAMEKLLAARRPPHTTPPLIDHQAPASQSFSVAIGDLVQVDLQLDQTISALRYHTRFLNDEDIYAVCLHRPKNGSTLGCLSGPQQRRTKGVLTLSFESYQLLQTGQLQLRVYSKESPSGELRKAIKIVY